MKVLKTTRLALISVSAILLVAALAYAQQHSHPHLPLPEHLRLATERVTVPLTFIGGRPVVSVMVNGKGPFPFILDTGAAGGVLTEDLARELALPALQSANIGSPGNQTVHATVTRIDSLDIGGATVEGLSAVYGDIGLLKVLTDSGQQVPRGVLSAEGFPGWIVSIDFRAAQVTFEKGELPAEDGKTIFEWSSFHPIPEVPLTLGDLTIKADIDTGSGSGLTLSTDTADRLPLEAKHLEEKPARYVGAQFPVTTAKLSRPIHIGAVAITDPPIRYTEGSTAGNIGQAVLKAFTVKIDSTNRRVQLVK